MYYFLLRAFKIKLHKLSASVIIKLNIFQINPINHRKFEERGLKRLILQRITGDERMKLYTVAGYRFKKLNKTSPTRKYFSRLSALNICTKRFNLVVRQSRKRTSGMRTNCKVFSSYMFS